MSKENNELVVISAIGKDLTGLTGLLTSVIYACNCNILDIYQSVTHGFYSVFIIVNTEGLSCDQNDFCKKIHNVGNQTGLKILIEDFHEGRRKSFKKFLNLYLIGEDKPGVVATTATTLSNFGINIENICMAARNNLFIMKMDADISDTSGDLNNIQAQLKNKLNEMGIGIIFEDGNLYVTTKKLIIFEINTSYIKSDFFEKIFEIEEIRNITKKQQDGLNNIAKLLDGINIKTIESINNFIKVDADTEEITRDLECFGFKIAAIYIGFKFIIDRVKELLNLNYSFGNTLKVNETKSVFKNELNEPIISSGKKSEVINLICQAEGLNPDDVISVNDFSSAGADFSSSIINIQLEAGIIEHLLKLYKNKELSAENIAGIILAFCYSGS